MWIISSVALVLSTLSFGWLIIYTRKTNKVQNKFNMTLLDLLIKQNSSFEEWWKCFADSQGKLLTDQMARVNHDSACLHYILAALRPYLFNVLDNAVKHEQYENASVCREMINNIDRLIQTDFTKINTK